MAGRGPVGPLSSRWLATSSAARSSRRCPRDVLGVGLRCTEANVKAAFREKAKRLHPDIQPAGDRDAAVSRFQELEEAYRTLLGELKGSQTQSTWSPPQGGARPESWGAPSSDPSWERVRQAAAAEAEKKPALPDIGALLVFALVAALAVRYAFVRMDRRQEELDALEFGAKRVQLRQANAEREQRELQVELMKRSGRVVREPADAE